MNGISAKSAPSTMIHAEETNYAFFILYTTIEDVRKLWLVQFITALDAKFSNRNLCKLKIIESYSYFSS
jgi:hypothetical protein